MTTRPPRRRAPSCQDLEGRNHPDAIGLAAAAIGLFSSPVVVAARTAATAYQLGQFAYTGHTSFLLGSVQVTEPYALKSLLARHHHAPGAAASHRVVPPTITFQAPTWPHFHFPRHR